MNSHSLKNATVALFAFTLFAFAALQLNDPDPLAWTSIYAAAGLVALARAFGRQVRVPAASLALIAGAWTLTLVPGALQLHQLAELTQGMDIMRPEIELARELGGLLIVTSGMGALARGVGATRLLHRPRRTRPARA